MPAPKQKPIAEKETQPAPVVNAEVLANHYQKTYEVAYEHWKERNKLFVTLVLTAGIGLLLLLRVPEANSLLVDAITKFLGVTDAERIKNLYANFPFNVLLSGILVVIFYLMQRLYSTNLSVMRNYMYLGAIEKEIRGHLRLPTDSVSFTREGNFYWGKRSPMQSMSKYYYVAVLFIILIPFIAFKLIADFQEPNVIVLPVDVAVSLMAVLYWWEYARSSFQLDKPKLSQEQPKK